MSAVDEKLATIYVDLDCLLDTRLGTLAKVNKELAAKVVESGKAYFKREMDEFEGYTVEEFKELYKKRDVETLQNSVITNMFSFLQTCVKGVVKENFAAANNYGFEVEVNCWPYELEDDEILAIKEIVEIKLFGVVPVKMTNIADKHLTPTYCKASYSMMIRYHFEEWLMMHVEELEKVQMPKISLIAPALFQKKMTPEDEEYHRTRGVHPLMVSEQVLAPVIQTRFMDVSLFSMLTQYSENQIETPVDLQAPEQQDGIKEGAEAEAPAPAPEISQAVKSEPASSEEEFPLL